MTRYIKSDVTVGDNVKSDVNVQLGLIEDAIGDTLSRVGDSPNSMLSDLDMNSNQILNLLDAVTSGEPVTLRQALSTLNWTRAESDAKYYDTSVLLEADTTLIEGDIAFAIDRAYASYQIQADSYTPLDGDLTLSNGLFAKLQTNDRDQYVVDYFGTDTEANRSSANSSTFDNAVPINACIDRMKAENKRGPVILGTGYYRTESVITLDDKGFWLEGAGDNETHLFADHTSGAVVRCMNERTGIKDIYLDASDTRQLAAHDSTNFGIHFESIDEVSSSIRMFGCFIINSTITGQPSVGAYVVGIAFTGEIRNSMLSGNQSHGVVFDRGILSSRVNLITTGISGVANLYNCRLKSNEGHSIVIGNPTDNYTTQALRVVLDNCETGSTSVTPSKLFEPADMYVRSVNVTFNECGMTADSSRAAVFVAGRNIHFNNARFLDCLDNAIIVGSYDILPTDGIYINGMTIINPFADLDPAILLQTTSGEGTEPKGISVNTWNRQNIANLIGTDSSMGSGGANRIPNYVDLNSTRIAVKNADQSVNNTTSTVNDSELRMWVEANEKLTFEFTIYYSGNATADIKFACSSPSGSTIIYGIDNSIKINASGVLVIASVDVSNNQSITLGAATGDPRMAVIKGTIRNSSTADYMRLKFAQVVATVADTTIHLDSSLVTRTFL